MCMHRYVSYASPQLLAAFFSQMKPVQPNSGRLQGLAVVPRAQRVSAPTSHFHGCPLQPWLLILSPALQARGQPSTPPQQLPIFAWPRPHLTTPSWHQMLPINFVRTQLTSVNCKAQTPNILQMKQQQAHCQWLSLDPSPCSTLLRQLAENKPRAVWGFARGISSTSQGQAALQPSA